MDPNCVNCGNPLSSETIDGQMVVFCPTCGDPEPKGVDDADVNREVVINQWQGLVGYTEGHQGIVDNTAIIQQPDPGVDPQQEGNPER